MAYTQDSKPLELTELSSLATDDTIIVGDTSDTSEVVKYITKANLLTDFGSTFAATSHTHATSDITSGTMADARIAESNVTQHQAALSITESQISDLGTYLTSSNISDTAYGVGWNTDTTNAPSKNAVYDKIETLQDVLAEGAFVDGDKTKLDGIETGATADQSAAEIKTAYESNADTNAFTDAEQTKLGTVETNADVTDTTNVRAAGASIVSSGAGAPSSTPTAVGDIYIDTTNDNAYIATGTASSADWEISNDGTGSGGISNVVEDTTPQLGGDLDLNGNDITDSGATARSITKSGTGALNVDSAGGGLNLRTTSGNGDVTVSAHGTGTVTVAGRDVAADGTKLDTIETNADVTDTVNVTAAGALMDSELTDITAVKALNQGVATTDDVTHADIQVTGEAYFDGEVDNGNSGTADTINWTTGNKQKSTLTGNCTFTFTAPSGPCNIVLKVVQDGTGSRTVTWPATVKWAGGTAPTLTTTASATDIFGFYFDGTNYFGGTIGLAFA